MTAAQTEPKPIEVYFRLDRRAPWKLVATVASPDEGYVFMRSSMRSGDWWITQAKPRGAA